MTPDTGPGLSGFLAHLVWQVYRHFPSGGTYDWLLLLAASAAAVYGVYLPLIWASVRFDMHRLKNKRAGELTAETFTMCWGLVWLFFLVWFFHTTAGLTFFTGRHLPGGVGPGEHHRPLFWAALGVTVAVLCGLYFAGRWAYEQLAAGGLTTAGLCRRRTLACLYAEGGMLVHQPARDVAPSIGPFVVVLLLAHAFYWYWSAMAEVLMLFFLAAALLAEVARMGFVYVWHKWTFG